MTALSMQSRPASWSNLDPASAWRPEVASLGWQMAIGVVGSVEWNLRTQRKYCGTRLFRLRR
jgi:hypothetical protein